MDKTYLYELNGCSWCGEADPFDFDEFRKSFNGAYMANLAYDKARGNTVIANPDSVVRSKADAPLSEADSNAVYDGAEQGHTGYTFYNITFFVTPIWIGINT